MYFVEYTDTFGGEANYCWVRRALINTPKAEYRSAAYKRDLLRRARRAVGITGKLRGDVTADYGDELHWVPRGCCTVLMIRSTDSEAEVAAHVAAGVTVED
jgi:hypothetical protein